MPEETKEILRNRVEKELTQETLSFLHKKTEGWVAGLILFIENSKLQGFDYPIPDSLTPNEIFEYFANEIFQRADQEVQAFLLRTAFLPSMTVSTAEKLSGIESAGRILENLIKDNFFTERRLEGHAVYLYHTLFREFLLSRALETFAPDEIRGLRQGAAALLIESGYVDDAVALLTQAQDWNGLIPLIVGKAPSLVAQGRSSTLGEWIGRIPQETLENTPWLLYWKGICTLPFVPDESRKLLDRAFQLFDAQNIQPGLFLAWSGAVQTFLFEFHDFKPLDGWIDWLDARMSGGVSFPSADIAASVAAGMMGALAWRRPNHPDVRRWVDTALSLAHETSNVDTALRAYTNSALYYLWMGEFGDCSILIEHMRNLAQSRSTSPSRLIALKVAEAMFYNSLADYQSQAIRSVLDGMEIAERTGVHVFDPTLSIQGAYSSLNEGDLGKTKEFLSKMEPFLGNRHANSSYFFYFSAWRHLLGGDINQAAVSAEKSLHLIEAAGVPVSEALIRFLLAQVLKEKQDYEGAYAQLRNAGNLAEETGSPYLKYLHDMIEAYFAFSLKRDEIGLQSLRRGLSQGRQRGFATIIHFWRPAVMSALCIKALESGIEIEHVQGLIRKLRLVPDVPPMGIEGWPWPVKIYTLGRFELIIKGETIRKPSKAQKKPLLMLKALISLGARDVKEEHLTDILWPDADGDAGHNALTTTLARLRRMLGDERAVHLHDGRVSLDNRLCWVDRWLFERLCGRAEALLENLHSGKADPADLKQIMARAAELYGGHFLRADADEHWTVDARERLRNKYLRLIGEKARYSEKMGDDEEAARYYQKGLESDHLAEEFYQGLLASYIRLGRYAEALRVYRQCKQALRSELGISPSPKTETLRKRIPGSS
jgi:DNA-binding SARP family transcriptional activator